jgi:hypothetical protein
MKLAFDFEKNFCSWLDQEHIDPQTVDSFVRTAWCAGAHAAARALVTTLIPVEEKK